MGASDKGVCFKTTSGKPCTHRRYILFMGQTDGGLNIAGSFRMFWIPSNRENNSNWLNSKGNLVAPLGPQAAQTSELDAPIVQGHH